MAKFEIFHPQEEFTGISYGLKFVRSKAVTDYKPLAERFKQLGFRVVEVAPKAEAKAAPAKPAPTVTEPPVPAKAVKTAAKEK